MDEIKGTESFEELAEMIDSRIAELEKKLEDAERLGEYYRQERDKMKCKAEDAQDETILWRQNCRDLLRIMGGLI